MIAVDESGTDTLLRDKAVRLFTYLKELTELRGDVKRSCDEYDQIIWWAEIPREKECYCAAWDLGREAAYDDWLRVERPRRKRPPSPPPALLPWLNERDISDASQDAPPLRNSIVEELVSNKKDGCEPEAIVRRLEECPTVQRQLELYVENHWWPWALEERRLQPVQTIYNELFAAYQNQERLGEAYEVVVGVGLLMWRPPRGPEIKRHVVVAQAAIEFDSKTGIITVGLPADGARLSLEQDMLEPHDRPLPDVQNRIQQELSEIGDGLWAGPGLATALNAYFQQLSPENTMDAVLEPQNGSTNRTKSRMNLAPALIVRQRSDRNLVRIFSEIATQISQGETIPLGVEKLVTIRDDRPGFDADCESAATSGDPEETYFPLPSNDEQRQIAQRLVSRQGILVQGPPGTGKSHTITNLICHLLATGKRLLVTSHTARALRVLKKYFPPEFSPLCVSLLGDDTTALRELEESVQGILSELNQWDSAKKQARMRQLTGDVDRSRRELAEGYGKLKAVRASETEAVDLRFGEYCGTPQSLAFRLAAAADLHAWLNVNVDPASEPPLTNGEAVELLHLWRDLGEDPDGNHRKPVPGLGAIPSPASFDEVVLKERDLSARLHSATSGISGALRILSSITIETRRALESGLRGFLTLLDKLSNQPEEWVGTAVQEVVRGKYQSWQNLSSATTSKLSFLKDLVEKVAQLKVSGIDGRDRAELRVHAETLRDHLLAGKSTGISLRYNLFAAKLLRASLYLLDEVRVNGRSCERHTELTALLEYLDVINALQHIDEQWSAFSAPSTLPLLLRFGDQVRRAELLTSVLSLREKAEALNAIIARDLPNLQVVAFHDRQAIAGLLELFAAANIQDELKVVQATIWSVTAELRSLRRDPRSHSLCGEVLAAVDNRDLDGIFTNLRCHQVHVGTSFQVSTTKGTGNEIGVPRS